MNMRFYLLILFCFFFSNSFAAHNSSDTNSSGKSSGLTFIQNKNQWNKKVEFKADIPGGFLYLEKNGFTFDFIDGKSFNNVRGHGHTSKVEIAGNIKAHCLKTTFINSNALVSISAIDKVSNYYNYFLGKDNSKWAGNVPGFNKVKYNSLYKDIDLVVYSMDSHLKYDFIVKPDGNPSQIVVNYQGADNMELKNGHLIVKTSINEFTEQKPYAYQIIEGVLKEVPCTYVLNENQITYFFPQGYDKSNELIIDPVLVFSTFSGSFSNNFGYTATFDSKGFLYAGSTAFGTDYPVTAGAYQITWATGVGGYGANNNWGVDIAISKYDTSGTSMIYSTYLGGSGDELPHSLVVNKNDELFIYGTTGSSDFPVTSNAYNVTFNSGPSLDLVNGLGVNFPSGTDIFVSRLNNDGSQLSSSTFLGGSKNDGINYSSTNTLKYNYADEVRGEIDIDEQNNIYIVSSTLSADFPSVGNSFQPSYGGGAIDGVVIKMDNNLSSIIWSSFIGGNSHDAAYSLALDSNNDLYLSGGTSSSDFPVLTGGLQNSYQGGRSDGFILHISKNGQKILNGTYYGSSAYDQIYFVELDKQNNVYVFGQTEASGNTFIHNASYAKSNSGQFISKIAPQLDSLIFSTAFGTGSGGPNISPTAFLVDYCNKIYLSGWGGGTNQSSQNNAGYTSGMDVTANAFQSTTDGSDFYLMVMEDDASALAYGSFFGGNQSKEHVDGGTNRFDRKGKIYQTACAGCNYSAATGNSDFPIHPNPGAVSSTNNSNCNSAVFKFDFGFPLTVAEFEAPAPGCAPYTVQFNNYSTGGTTSYFWDFGDGNTSTDYSPVHEYTSTGMFNVMLVTYDTASCNLSDTMFAQVLVLSDTSYSLTPQTICGSESVQLGLNPINDPSITYQWSPATGLSDTTVSNPFSFANQNIEYTLIISNGICTDTLLQTVYHYPDVLTVSPDTAFCGNANLTLIASTFGNYSQYIWSTNNMFSDTLNQLGDSTLTVNVSNTSTFYVMASESVCSLSDSVVITNNEVNIQANDLEICFGDTAILIANDVIGNQQLFYSWNPSSEIITGVNSSTALVSPNQSAVFTVVGENSIGCKDSAIATVNISALNSLIATTSQDTITAGNSVVLQVLPTSGYTYNWSPSNSLNNSQVSSPVATPIVTTTYTVSVADSSCIYKDSVTVYVHEIICDQPNIFIPNAFTPNGDNQNDLLFVRGKYIDELFFTVYNRWGEKVFETTDQSVGWDGTYKGMQADPGVFVYYLKVKCFDSQETFKKGNVTLIR